MIPTPPPPSASPMTLAASYARCAIPDPVRIAAQHHKNHQTACWYGLDLPDDPEFRFADDGASGADFDRPGLTRMLAAVRAGAPFGYVCVADFPRLGRFQQPAQMLELIRSLARRRVELIVGGETPNEFIRFRARLARKRMQSCGARS